MLVLRLSWRNLWRNPRRSLITISAIACGYIFLIVLIGLTAGIAQQMLLNGTGLLTGDLQLHHPHYLPERSLFDTLGGQEPPDRTRLVDQLNTYPGVQLASPRVYGFGLVSTGEHSAGAQLLGIDPDLELRLTTFLQGLVEGRLLRASARREVLLGDTLAQELEAGVGSELAIVSQAADGSLGNDLFQVAGILHTGMNHLDRALVVVDLQDLQQLLALNPDQIHEMAVRIDDPMQAEGLAGELNHSGLLPSEALAQSWGELSPQLRDYVGLAQGANAFMIFIIGLFTAIGVLNTMMMAVFERTLEIGLVNCLGMRPALIVSSILLESLFLAILGLAAGLAAGAWLMSYLSTQGLDLSHWTGELSMLGTRMDPVLKATWQWRDVWWSALGLLTATLLAAFLPARRAAAMDPVEAMGAPVEG